MYVHQGAGLIYLANPRTASRATAKALMGIGFKMEGSHHSGPGLRFIDVTERRPDEWVVFTTVRDIQDTLESWARKLGMAGAHDSEVILAEMKRGNQFGIIEGWEPWTLFPHTRHADLLLRYEKLEKELNMFLGSYALGPVELEVVR